MGQQEVLQCLELKRKWMCVIEIAMATQTNIESVRRSLNQMYKYKEVMKKEKKRISLYRGIRVRYWRIR